MVDDVMRGNRMLALVAQRGDEPQQAGPDDLYTIGTAAIIHQLMRAPDGTVRLIVQGLERIRLLDFVATEPYLVARVAAAPDRMSPGFETEGLRRAVLDLFRRLVALIPEVPDEVAAAAETRDRSATGGLPGGLDRSAGWRGAAGDPRAGAGRGQAAAADRDSPARGVGARAGAADRRRNPGPDDESAARVLPARAAPLDSAGAGRGWRRSRDRRAAAQDRGGDAAGGCAA